MNFYRCFPVILILLSCSEFSSLASPNSASKVDSKSSVSTAYENAEDGFSELPSNKKIKSKNINNKKQPSESEEKHEELPDAESLEPIPVDKKNIAENIDVSKIGKANSELDSYNFIPEEGSQNSAQNKGSEALFALKAINSSKDIKKSKSEKNINPTSKQNNFFVVSKVNSEVITNFDVINAIRFIFFSCGKEYNEKTAKLMINSVISTLIEDKLHEQYARFYKIKITDADTNSKVTEIAENNHLTIEQLSEEFEKLGINMEMFKRNIKSRMLLSFITKIVSENTQVLEQEMKEAKTKAENEIKHTRYHLAEILFKVEDEKSKPRIRENAEAVLQLLREGFSFHVLAENLSQGNYFGTVGDLGWVIEENLEQPVRDIISSINPGEASEIIETKTGYKIICVIDKAAPNKCGEATAKHKFLISTINYKGGIFTEKDQQATEEKVGSLAEVDTAEKYKEVCKKYNIPFEEKEIDRENAYELDLVAKAKEIKKTVIAQSPENEDSLKAVFLVSSEVPSASVPDKKELLEQVTGKKTEKEFSRNFKRVTSTSLIYIDKDNLAKVLSSTTTQKPSSANLNQVANKSKKSQKTRQR